MGLSPLTVTPRHHHHRVSSFLPNRLTVRTFSFPYQGSQLATSLPRCQLMPQRYVVSITRSQIKVPSSPTLNQSCSLFRVIGVNRYKELFCGFAPQGGNDTTYICANNNGEVQFFSALLDNNKLTLTEVSSTCLEAVVEPSEDILYVYTSLDSSCG